MKIFDVITQAFINFFGITQPDRASRSRATVYICGLLSLILLLFGSFFVVMRFRSR